MDRSILTKLDYEELLRMKYKRKNGVSVQQFMDIRGDKSILEHPYNYDPDPDTRIERMHGRYLSYVADRKILLHHEEHGFWTVPYVVRGTEQYHFRTQDNIENVRQDWDSRKHRDNAMLITIAPRAKDSVWQLHKHMKKWWPSFMDWLRKRFHTDRYVWAMEPTKRHYSHYHLVYQGRHPKGLMAQEILKWWQKHDTDIENPGVDVQYARGDPCQYAMKYTAKGTTDPFWCALLWFSGGRIWGRSRGLGQGRGEINSEKDSDWIVLGSINVVWIKPLLNGDIAWEDIGSLEWYLHAPP